MFYCLGVDATTIIFFGTIFYRMVLVFVLFVLCSGCRLRCLGSAFLHGGLLRKGCCNRQGIFGGIGLASGRRLLYGVHDVRFGFGFYRRSRVSSLFELIVETINTSRCRFGFLHILYRICRVCFL